MKDSFIEKTLIKALCLMISFAMLVLTAMPAAIYAEEEVVDSSAPIAAENEAADSSEPVVTENETTDSPAPSATEGESTDQTSDEALDMQETNASEASDEQNPDASAEAEEAQKPKVPQIKVTIKDDGLRVKWDRLDGAKSYKIYRSYRKSQGSRC